MNSKKIIVYLFYFLLFSLFFQTRFSPFGKSQVSAYLIPFIYFSDLLIISLFALITLIYFNDFKQFILILWQKNKPLLICWLSFLLSAAFANLFARSPLIAWFTFLKLIEFSFFALAVSFLFFKQVIRLQCFWLALNIGLLLESFIALGEFLLKRSLGLQFLGEWQFSIFTPGIAKAYFLHHEFLRPYATFPHPNILGTIMAIVSIGNLYLFLANTATNYKIRLLNIICFLVFALIALLSFSETAWLTFSILILFLLLTQVSQLTKKIPRLILLIFPLLFFSLLALNVFKNAGSLLPIQQRIDLMTASLRIIKTNPLGIGLSNFTLRLSPFNHLLFPNRIFEPVHNLWLLAGSETGILGLLFFLLFFFYLFRISLKSEQRLGFIFLLGIISASLTDHFWWTLQAGQLFFWLTIGVILANLAKAD